MTALSLKIVFTNNYRNLNLEEGLGLDNLNIFIGPNGSGKSSVIGVLEFLKNCIAGTSDDAQSVSSFTRAVFKLGGSRMLTRAVEPPSTIALGYALYGLEGAQDLSLMLALDLFAARRDAPLVIAREELLVPSPENPEPFYYYKFHDKEAEKGVVSVWNDATETGSHYENLKNVPTDALGLAVLHELLEKSPSPPERTPVYGVRRQIIEWLRTWQFYNANYMDLNLIRNAEPKLGPPDIYLSPTGDNLALVIENLFQQDLDFEDRLNAAIRSILPHTRRLRPVRTGLMRLNLNWHVEGIAEPFYLHEMSDGTVRMLCWATILLSPKLPRLLVIDEPEIGIHPAWMGSLAAWIKQAAEKTQVIVCTHSPDLLDHFTDSPERVICFSSPDQKSFTAAPLSIESLEHKLAEGWQLGDLYRVGDPTVGAWPW